MTDAIAEAVAETTDDAEIRVGLERFVALLLERNAATNLTSARDPAAVMLHVRDSLGLVPFVGHTHVDIGSGGGFPGLVLAIATRKPITLVESLAKKATFLREVAALLGLHEQRQPAAGQVRDGGLVLGVGVERVLECVSHNHFGGFI